MTKQKTAKKPGKKVAPSGNEKIATRAQFLVWVASPADERDPKTAGEFAKLHKVSQFTLSRWRQTEEFENERKALVRKWGTDKMPSALKALYQGVIINKRGADFKVLAQYVEDWAPKESGVLETPALTGEVEKLRTTLRDMIAGIKETK